MKRTDGINWVKIENEYVTGTMSYGDIAELHGISYSCVKDHGLALGWRIKRAEYRQDCTKKTAEKTADKVSDDLSKLAEIQMKSALELAIKLNQYIRTVKNIKPREMLQLAQTLKALNDTIARENSFDETAECRVVILPARTEIDLPPDDSSMNHSH